MAAVLTLLTIFFFFVILLVGVDRFGRVILFFRGACLYARYGDGPWSRAFDGHARALEALVDDHLDHDTVAPLDVAELGALLVQ